MKKRDKELAAAFNDQRRSSARMLLLMMGGLELFTEGEVEQFSGEIRSMFKTFLHWTLSIGEV